MNRRSRMFTYIFGGIAALLIAVVIGAILIARTQRFKEFVRTKIISETEDATGGSVELSSFDFDWRHLRARMTDFVIHGTEPSGSAPLFQARSLELRLKLLSGLKKAVDLQYLGVEQPSANIIVFPDGRTNIPEPKIKKKSDKSGLETVVDLAIHKFEIVNGSVQFAEQGGAGGSPAQTSQANRLPHQTEELTARGENLRAQLFFNPATSAYKGEVAIAPLFVATGKREPLNVTVSLPVTLARDRIDLSNARIATPESTVVVNGAVENMKAPVVMAHLNARVSLPEIKRTLNAPIYPGTAGAPSLAEADVNARVDENTIEISSARVAVGQTTLEASGKLKDPSQRGSLRFNTNLALNELSRLLQVAAQPEGSVQLSGQAKFKDASDYLLTGAIQARNVSIRQGTTRVRQINLTSAVKADPHVIDLSGMRLSAFGGELLGNARLADMERLTFGGRLANFDLQRITASLGSSNVDYSGVLGGTVQAEGNVKAPGSSGLEARTQLAIVPGRRGVPVSGRIAARYSGAADTVSITNSYIALPHSKLDVSGALDKRIDLRLISTNLNDFLPAAALASTNPPKEMPVTLNGGAANIDAQVMGKLAAPRITGHVAVTKFAVEQRAFDQLTADLAASPSGAQVQNGLLTRGPLRADFGASVGMRNWTAGPRAPLAANATIRGGDLADIVALAGQKDVPISGGLNASARISGTIANPQGDAKIVVVNGSAYEEPFDRFDAQVNLSDQLVTLSPVVLTKGASKIDVNGTFRHPSDSFDTGHVQLHVASNAVTLEQLRTLEKERPGFAGAITLNADAEGDLLHPDGRPEFSISAVNANLSARNLRERSQRLGDVTANAQTSGNNVNFRVDSDFAGSNILVTGVTRLAKDYPTTADASIRDLPIERVLSVARANQVPARGIFSAKAHVDGTMNDPRANVDFALAEAVVYEERIDKAQATVNYTSRSIEIPSLHISVAGGQFDGNASFAHPQNDFDNGHVQLHLASSGIQLASIQHVAKAKPGLTGRLRLLADAAADLRTQAGKQDVLFSKLDADIGATGIELNRKPFGGATFRAETKGQQLSFQIDSDIANAAIHGNGTAQLRGDYPLDARLTFANVKYSSLQRLTTTAATEARTEFEALAEGQITANGPALKTEDMRAALEVARLQLTTGKEKQIAIQNQGPLRVEMDHSVVNVTSFRLANHSTNLSVGGKVDLKDKTPLDLSIDGNADLSLLQELMPDAYSSGSLTMKAAVRGGFDQPVINGRIDLKNASVNIADAPNGIANANGSILLNGTSAVIQNLTAESGGGKITLSGFVGFTGTTLRYRVRANADHVRSRYSGASVVASADLNLNGTSERSLLAGTVTIQRVAYSSSTDVGSILSQSATPPKAPSAPSGPVAGMRLDIRIRTAPDVRFQTALATQLQADADLNLVGTLDTTGMVGRVNVTQGELVFFSNQYTVNRGVISFYNSLRIEPIMDVALETTVKGVDVNLEVAGPVDNMKLTYRSDPPLRFDEIVELLAAGKTPTSDPTIAAHQPAPPEQSFAQMGESAIVSKAVAAPLANRLERVFGINQLKIDPTFTAGSALPQARLTLQQRISGNLTFTYTTDLAQTNKEIVRVEWALNPRFSAVATRDENGYFGVDFFYKKQFR